MFKKLLTMLNTYLERMAYERAYRKAGTDDDCMAIAEEGMDEYKKQLDCK